MRARAAAATSGYDSYALTTAFYGACQVAIGSAQPFVQPGSQADISAGILQPPCLFNPLFEFWLRPPGGAWRVTRPYSTEGWWTWTTGESPPGVYQYGLWVKESTSSQAYDGYFIGSIQLLRPDCTEASITNVTASPQAPGTMVTFSVSASGACATRGKSEVWMLPPGSSTWKIANPYSTYVFGPPKYDWTTTGLPAGPYQVGVWVKQPLLGDTKAYDAYAITTFWLVT